MLKHLPLIPIFELTNIIANIIKLGYFPLKWKTAAVIPILKPLKDPTRAYSFRPIALLSILGKVSEKIILKRLYHHVDSINLILPEQHGFSPTRPFDLPPTLESGGSDKVRIQKTKIDWNSIVCEEQTFEEGSCPDIEGTIDAGNIENEVRSNLNSETRFKGEVEVRLKAEEEAKAVED
ncbi:putative RNA-directed DNA polymerase from transposon X-element [Trichonephila clavipes]|nr:putative RNA-directed DNA polymerase from transposon X-element [Trichonephila clavipes]